MAKPEVEFILTGGFFNFAEPSIPTTLTLAATTPLLESVGPELIVGAKYRLVKVEE